MILLDYNEDSLFFCCIKDGADLKVPGRSVKEVLLSEKLRAMIGHVSSVHPPCPILSVHPTMDKNHNIIYQISPKYLRPNLDASRCDNLK
jgi:hypothetical protein